LNFCLRNNPARLLAAAGKEGEDGGRRTVAGRARGGGPTSFPRSLQWVYSNTQRDVESKKRGERERERGGITEKER